MRLLIGTLALTLWPTSQAHGQVECIAQSFCSSLPNSSGSPALMSAGNCLPGGTLLDLEASPVPGAFGLFFYSSSPANGSAGVPFGNGLRCVGGIGDLIFRLAPTPTVAGVLASAVDLTQPPSVPGTIVVGSTWYFQGWYRDPAAGGAAFNFSEALEVEFVLPRYKILHIVLDDIGIDLLRMYDDQNAYDGDNPLNVQEDVTGTNLYPWTPCLDQLAECGIRFNQFRVNPTCSTTRASMISGRYAFRHGIGALVQEERVGGVGEFGVGPGNDEYTIAQIAAAGGYRTGFTGKWHLSLPPNQVALGGLPGYGYPHLADFGHFDEHWMLMENLDGRVIPPPVNIPGVSGSPGMADDVIRGYWNYYSYSTFGSGPHLVEHWNQGDYATAAQLEYTGELITSLEMSYPHDPWFVMASLSAAHSPYGDVPNPAWVTTQEYLPAITPYGLAIPGGTGVQTAWRGQNQLFESLDNRLLDMFDQLGGLDLVLQDTIVIVTGDNGTSESTMNSAMSQHGKDLGSVYSQLLAVGSDHFKHTVYEQGIRAPMIVAGPVVAAPGSVSNALVDGVDIHATIAELSGVAITDVTDGRTQDGVSIVGLLTGETTDEEHILTARGFSFAERFSPNGDPRVIVPPIFNENSRRRAYVGYTPNGWFKIVRRLDSSGVDADEFYHLNTELVPLAATTVDPSELDDLFGQPAFAADYDALHGELDALLASEP